MPKHFLPILIALLTALCCCQRPAFADQVSSDLASAILPGVSAHQFGLLLTGSAKHKEYLEPVPPCLMTGAKFDEHALPQLTPTNNWIPIPAWLAGTWQFKTENVTAIANYTREKYRLPPYTILNECQKTFGQQKDRSGQIWHYLKAPYSYTSKLSGGLIGHERVTSTEALSGDNLAVDLKLTGTDTTVNPRTQLITHTDESEEFHRYTPAGNDEIIHNGSGKFFNMRGQPTMELVSYMKARRIKSFAVINEQDGEDLRQMFVDFLKSHGKSYLIPQLSEFNF